MIRRMTHVSRDAGVALAMLTMACAAQSAPLDARAIHQSLTSPLIGSSTAPSSAAVWTGAGAASLADGAWSELAPPQRIGRAAIFDSLRDRMIVFGGGVEYSTGTTAVDSWALSFPGAPSWNRLATSGVLPDQEYELIALYDVTSDRMLVIGQGGRAEISALSLADLTWSRVPQTGTAGSAQTGMSTIYDPLRNRLLVFGGCESVLHAPPVYHNDVWALNLSGTPTWTQLNPLGTPPSPRYLHSAVYDPAHDRMVVFGGAGAGGALNSDAWSLDLSSGPVWSQLTPSGVAPSPRAGALSCFDAGTAQMLIFGGSSGSPGNDVWALSLGDAPSWTAVTPAGALPAPRIGASLVLDNARQHLLYYGGRTLGTAGETWSLAPGGNPQWTKIVPAPPGRNWASAAYDPITDHMIVFGGFSNAALNAGLDSALGDLWVRNFDEAGWTPLIPAGAAPSARVSASAIVDPVRHSMILFGGESGAGVDFNEAWELSLDGAPAWTLMNAAGAAPAPRWSARSIYDPVRNRMVVLGGLSSGATAETVWNDVWTLSLGNAPEWTQLLPAGTAPAQLALFYATAYDPIRDRMLVTTGDSTWALTFAPTPSWSLLSANGAPGMRDGPSVIYDPLRDRLVLFGGATESNNDVWALSLTGTPQWTTLSPTGPRPTRRMNHAAVYDSRRDQMVVFGGFTWGQGINTFDYNDTWALAWGDITTAIAPSLEAVVADAGDVRLTWSAVSRPGASATVYRAELAGPWQPVAWIFADGSGRLAYEDRLAEAGRRYGYRIGMLDGAIEKFFGEVWVDVPSRRRISLAGLKPNPARNDLVASFSLADASPAEIAVFDLSGREVVDERLGALGPGAHEVRLGHGRILPAGVYLVRLTQGEATVTARGAVVR